jgi:hypothetical protein
VFRFAPVLCLLVLAACSGRSHDDADAGGSGFCERKLAAADEPARYEPAQSGPGYNLSGIGAVLANYAESAICVATR